VAVRLNEVSFIEFTRTESYDHAKYNDVLPIQGWRSNSLQLTLIY